MEIYLVGGAVRDQLLGLPVKERDWVVVGTSVEEMLNLGYIPVGKDFPVFLHPETHEEYALARTERKISKGYTGFKFYTDISVTLEEDLRRRDLTINAIAKKSDGEIIDPYHGCEDLKNKILRHVSEAFAEDPVRILRLARFASRFTDFKIHPETLELMRFMVASGEVNALVAERVWQELQRTLELPSPHRFFEILQECGALAVIFPEIDAHVSEAINRLRQATKFSCKSIVRFAALTKYLSLDAIKSLCLRVRIPSSYRELALLVVKYQEDFDRILYLDAEGLLNLLEKLDAFRRAVRFVDFLTVNDAACGQEQSFYSKRLMKAYNLTAEISPQPLIELGLQGEAIKIELHALRCEAIANNL
jgi:tRNA nucleotidyltransferase (CCA-adding enzyme)